MANWTVAVPSFWWPAYSGLGSDYVTNRGLFANASMPANPFAPFANLTPVKQWWSTWPRAATGGILADGTQVLSASHTNFDPSTDLATILWTGWAWQEVLVANGLANIVNTINDLPAPNQIIGNRPGGNAAASPWPSGSVVIPAGAPEYGW